MADLDALWDFSDPAASEARLRSALDEAHGPDAGILTTQVARALGLQDRFDEAHAVLDAVSTDEPELAVRVLLERGRLHRSAGDVGAAVRLFESAARLAGSSGLDGLQVDALHMVALAVPAEQQEAATETALRAARESDDPAARGWQPSLLHNLGMVHADAGAWPDALVAFEAALDARRETGDPERVHVARWMVAWALRNLGRTSQALAIQRELRAELESRGSTDPYVDEELALLEGV